MLAMLVSAAFLIAQERAPAGIDGTVETASGEPADGARVFFSPDGGPRADGTVPILASTTTAPTGRFHFDAPDLADFPVVPTGTIWAYRPGSALATGDWTLAVREPIALRLVEEPSWKVRLVDRQGRPVSGVRVAPNTARAPRGSGGKIVILPNELALFVAGTTDTDGWAEVPPMGYPGPLQSARVISPEIGSQLIRLTPGDGAESQGVLERVGTLSGRVARRDGGPVEGLEANLQMLTGPAGIPQPIVPPGGPIRVKADGTFRTPDCLLSGNRYRVSFRGKGVVPGTSTLMEGPGAGASAEWPLVTLATTHEVAGRVVDRQGKPIPSAEVIQSGDGPDRTRAKVDAEGRFRLGGFDDGPALIAARAPGFRYGGRVVTEGENTIVLTRLSERPERPMPAQPPPLTPDELRATARKLLAPALDDPKAPERSRQEAEVRLLWVDPREARDRFAKAGKLSDQSYLRLLAPALYRVDPQAARDLVSGLKSAPDRSVALLAIYDGFRRGPDPRKPELLDELANLAENEDLSAWMVGQIAERLAESGRTERASALFARGLPRIVPIGPDDDARVEFAVSLGCLQPETALNLIREVKKKESRIRALHNLGLRVALLRPAEYDRITEALETEGESDPRLGAIPLMASIDPERARKLAETASGPFLSFWTRLSLAFGLAGTSKEEAERAYHEAIAWADASRGPSPLNLGFGEFDLVEAIDPDLMPEYLWFVASRREAPSPYRSNEVRDSGDARLAAGASRYHREYARVLIAPLLERTRSNPKSGPELALRELAQTVAQIDPPAALRLIDSLSKEGPRPGLTSPRDRAAVAVAEYYGRCAQGTPPPLLPGAITFYDQFRRRDSLR